MGTDVRSDELVTFTLTNQTVLATLIKATLSENHVNRGRYAKYDFAFENDDKLYRIRSNFKTLNSKDFYEYSTA